MSKRINKKILSLLLVAATLLQFGALRPMDPCKKPPTETTITALPPDCFHEIFRYLAKFNDKTKSYDIKPLLKLRFVCKDFRQAAKSFPGPLSFEFNCKNKKNIPLGNLFDEVENLRFNNYDFQDSNIVWPSNFLSLSILSCKNFDATTIPKRKNLRKFTVKHCCVFDRNGLEKLTNLHELTVSWCDQFKGAGLEKLTNLHTLTVDWCNNLDGARLEKLTNLRKFTVKHCCVFDRNGLEKLTKS